MKKALLTIAIVLLFAGSAGMIGWIGFQERFRLLARSFQRELTGQDTSVDTEAQAKALADHTVIETSEEAGVLVDVLEDRLTGLESDGLPEE